MARGLADIFEGAEDVGVVIECEGNRFLNCEIFFGFGGRFRFSGGLEFAKGLLGGFDGRAIERGDRFLDGRDEFCWDGGFGREGV